MVSRKSKDPKKSESELGALTTPGEPEVAASLTADASADASDLTDVSVAETAAARAEAEVASQSATEDVNEEIAPVYLPGDVSDEELARVTAALIFASDKPLTVSRLSEILGHSPARIRTALAAFGERLSSLGAPFHVAEIAGGYRFVTDPDLAKYVAALRGEQKKERLSGAALETLAIVAYRQPVTKGEIEAMRGVQAGPILRTLLDRHLVRVTGRAPVPGRPLQYGTTKEFLDRFQLASLKDLPTVEELVKP